MDKSIKISQLLSKNLKYQITPKLITTFANKGVFDLLLEAETIQDNQGLGRKYREILNELNKFNNYWSDDPIDRDELSPLSDTKHIALIHGLSDELAKMVDEYNKQKMLNEAEKEKRENEKAKLVLEQSKVDLEKRKHSWSVKHGTITLLVGVLTALGGAYLSYLKLEGKLSEKNTLIEKLQAEKKVLLQPHPIPETSTEK